MKSIKRVFARAALGLGLFVVPATAIASQYDNPQDIQAADLAPVLQRLDEAAPLQYAQAQNAPTATPQQDLLNTQRLNRDALKQRNAAQHIWNVSGLVFNNSYLDLTVPQTAQRLFDSFPPALLEQVGINGPEDYPQSQQTIRSTINDLVALAPNGEYMQFAEEVLDSFVSNLDAHSVYHPRRSSTDVGNQLGGRFGGLGIQIRKDEDTGFISVEGLINAFGQGPAERSGVLEGDLITHINGTATGTDEFSVEDASNMMRGEIGTDIEITIQREGEADPITMTVTRGQVLLNPAYAEVVDGVGYIALQSFTPQALRGIRLAIDELEASSEGAPNAYILDLRLNPGGLVDQATQIGDLFLEEGTLLTMRDKDRNETFRSEATPGDVLNGRELVVLVDGGSASASEIVSGVLQYYERATVIGTQSFGKGSVQSVIPLRQGSRLAITTQLYFFGDGVSPQGDGVTPDISVTFGRATDFNIDRREEDLPGYIPSQNPGASRISQELCSPANDDLSALLANVPERFQTGNGNVDSALLCAIEYLNNDYEFTRRIDNPEAANAPLPLRHGRDDPAKATMPPVAAPAAPAPAVPMPR